MYSQNESAYIYMKMYEYSKLCKTRQSFYNYLFDFLKDK